MAAVTNGLPQASRLLLSVREARPAGQLEERRQADRASTRHDLPGHALCLLEVAHVELLELADDQRALMSAALERTFV